MFVCCGYCAGCVSFPSLWQNTWDKQKKKRLILAHNFTVSVHGHLGLLPLGLWWGRTLWAGGSPHGSQEARKKRGKDQVPNTQFKGMSPVIYPSTRPNLLKVPPSSKTAINCQSSTQHMAFGGYLKSKQQLWITIHPNLVSEKKSHFIMLPDSENYKRNGRNDLVLVHNVYSLT
jgi:hypothetical protein